MGDADREFSQSATKAWRHCHTLPVVHHCQRHMWEGDQWQEMHRAEHSQSRQIELQVATASQYDNPGIRDPSVQPWRKRGSTSSLARLLSSLWMIFLNPLSYSMFPLSSSSSQFLAMNCGHTFLYEIYISAVGISSQQEYKHFLCHSFIWENRFICILVYLRFTFMFIW